MNDMPVSKIICIENPQEFKLHAARRNAYGVNPLDVYTQDKNQWVAWNRWRHPKDEFSRKYIFALIDFYPENDMWLFGGIYEVLERGPDGPDGYKIKELNDYSAYVGRLKVQLEKPSRGRAFYLEKHMKKMLVSEILKQPYSGEVFPGYEKINHDFSMLVPIFRNENADWKTALGHVKGVYAITDKSDGKRYIGSAYGDSGIWSRWCCYMNTGHGWSDELTKLIKSKGRGYAEKYFRLSLLEYRSMKTDDEVIIEREVYWKEVFLSRNPKFGYNKN